jgi:hypothetical protein
MKKLLFLLLLTYGATAQVPYRVHVDFFPKDYIGVGYHIFVQNKVYRENRYTMNPALADTIVRRQTGLKLDTYLRLQDNTFYEFRTNDVWIAVEKKRVYRKNGKLKYKRWKE